MTYALTAALVASWFACLWALDRRDKRAALEREADRAERQTLLQRIQAPEAAVMQHASEHAGTDETLPDEDLLDEETREGLERLESMERETAPWLS